MRSLSVQGIHAAYHTQETPSALPSHRFLPFVLRHSPCCGKSFSLFRRDARTLLMSRARTAGRDKAMHAFESLLHVSTDVSQSSSEKSLSMREADFWAWYSRARGQRFGVKQVFIGPKLRSCFESWTRKSKQKVLSCFPTIGGECGPEEMRHGVEVRSNTLHDYRSHKAF